jgi:hypothetical protein
MPSRTRPTLDRHATPCRQGGRIDCHIAIPFERLLLEPQSLRCAACQAIFERKSPP